LATLLLQTWLYNAASTVSQFPFPDVLARHSIETSLFGPETCISCLSFLLLIDTTLIHHYLSHIPSTNNSKGSKQNQKKQELRTECLLNLSLAPKRSSNRDHYLIHGPAKARFTLSGISAAVGSAPGPSPGTCVMNTKARISAEPGYVAFSALHFGSARLEVKRCVK
jgi:hypothetical protein